MITPATTQGKKEALKALEARRAKSKKEKRIDNASLPAGASMYYYCISCGAISDILPETHLCRPVKLCKECQALKDMGWLSK